MQKILVILLSFIIALFLTNCDSPVQPDENQGDIIIVDDNDTLIMANLLFVQSGANGNGTQNNPFGFIQTALDSAARDSSLDGIIIADGNYQESLTIKCAVSIIGGCDPANDWKQSASANTVIQGNSENYRNIGLLIENVDDTVDLGHVSIVAPDANQPGESSYGIYCLNTESVNLNQCTIRSGNGADGSSGENGIMPDTTIYSDIAVGGSGGIGGYEEGGYLEYGQFGYYWVCGIIHSAKPGDQGYCPDGTQEGGISDTNGDDGLVGIHGVGGSNQPYLITIAGYPVVTLGSGENGSKGSPGCGGGGGNGAPASGCGHASGAASGGNGGDGGRGGMPGTGGSGGLGGGCSIGIFSYQSNLTLENTHIYTGRGGRGGDDGQGGNGHPGEAGHPGLWGDYMSGSPGGDGGDGGGGGYGGGGAGGASIGIVHYQSNINTSDFSPSLGQPGSGGANFSGRAEDGLSVSVLEVLD